MKALLLSLLCLFVFYSLLGSVEETPWVDHNELKKLPGKVIEDAFIQSYYEDLEKPKKEENAAEAPLEEALDPSSLPPESTTPPYRIHVGDLFTISVYGEPGSQRTVRVDPTGSLSYLFIHDLSVIGKTIDEVRTILNEKLVYFYKFPLVVIIPRELFGNQYTILGQVYAPGTRKIVGNSTILSAIADAGGFQTRLFRQQTIDRADLDHSFLARRGEYYPVDFKKLVLDGDMSQNVALEDGDYLYFPMYFTDQVFVLGEVRAQRGINYVNQMTLLRAIAQAGGVTEQASSRIAILRGSLSCPVRYLVDYNRIVKGYTCDFLIMPGDIIYVPPRTFTNLRELWRWAVQNWIAQAASSAGTNSYINLNPKALSVGVVSPSPIIGGGVVTPVAPAAVAAP